MLKRNSFTLLRDLHFPKKSAKNDTLMLASLIERKFFDEHFYSCFGGFMVGFKEKREFLCKFLIKVI